MEKTPFVVIGLGPVGRAIAAGLVEAGWNPVCLVGRARPRDRQAARSRKTTFTTELSSLDLQRGVIFVATPTSQVEKVASALADLSLPWKQIVVVHCAGPLDANVLKPLASRGAGIVAAHPYQTFPRGVPAHQPHLQGTVWGVTGNSKGVAMAKRFVAALGGIPVKVDAAKRLAYHASAVMACSQTISNMYMAVQLLRQLGLPEQTAAQAVLAIVSETIRNVTELGIQEAWSGPAIRGDLTLIKRQTKALYPYDPITSQVYGLVSRWVMDQFGVTPPQRKRRTSNSKNRKGK